MITKICTKCFLKKSLIEFTKSKAGKFGRRADCMVCNNAAQNIRREKRKHIYNARRREKYCPVKAKNEQLLAHYNITLEQYNEMLNKQNHCCAICGKHESEQKRSLSTDHCHKSNKIRGLLCDLCNRSIGFLKDDPELILKAASYVALGGL
jgi:Recombination endonuclease VII